MEWRRWWGGGREGEDESYETYRSYIETRSAEVVVNILIGLIHQANCLLDRLIRQLEKAFLAEGALMERMMRARLEARQRGDGGG